MTYKRLVYFTTLKFKINVYQKRKKNTKADV